MQNVHKPENRHQTKRHWGTFTHFIIQLWKQMEDQFYCNKKKKKNTTFRGASSALKQNTFHKFCVLKRKSHHYVHHALTDDTVWIFSRADGNSDVYDVYLQPVGSVMEQANINNVHFPGTHQPEIESAVLSTHSRHHPECFTLMLSNTAAKDTLVYTLLIRSIIQVLLQDHQWVCRFTSTSSWFISCISVLLRETKNKNEKPLGKKSCTFHVIMWWTFGLPSQHVMPEICTHE